MSDAPGTAYLLEMLGRTLAERDEQLAHERQANGALVAENNQLRLEVEQLRQKADESQED